MQTFNELVPHICFLVKDDLAKKLRHSINWNVLLLVRMKKKLIVETLYLHNMQLIKQ